MPGLDPGIHLLHETLAKKMDCRVKPGNDGRSYFSSTGSGGTLSLGAPACMVISVIDVMS
jgi:hypothetical protein